MKKNVKVVLATLMVSLVLFTGCGDTQGGEMEGLVVGENAFETGVYIKCDSSEEARFYVEPASDEIRMALEEDWEDGGMTSGNFGTLALVEGKKKGEEADLDGAFTVFVNESGGPSVTIDVTGRYVIDELTSFENSYFFVYTDDGLKQVSQQEWKAF